MIENRSSMCASFLALATARPVLSFVPNPRYSLAAFAVLFSWAPVPGFIVYYARNQDEFLRRSLNLFTFFESPLSFVITMGRAADGSFVFTDHDNRVSCVYHLRIMLHYIDCMLSRNVLWAATSGAGAGLCFVVLSIIAVAMIHPASRHHLDRVSFRIMIYALTAK